MIIVKTIGQRLKMKIQYLSDLHIETCPFEYEDCDVDVVILAGDIHVGRRGVEWALETIKDRPVIYVLGNHEYYKHSFASVLRPVGFSRVESQTIETAYGPMELDVAYLKAL